MTDWEERRWLNFEPEEVLSPDGLVLLREQNTLVVQPRALDKLQSFRSFLDTPLLVNHTGLELRGYRSPAENERLGGAKQSFHTQGLAFDVSAKGMTSHELRDEALSFGWTGIGLYPSFVHMDVRATLDGRIITWEG